MIMSYTFCLLIILGAPGGRGPGARAPMTPLLIRHCKRTAAIGTAAQRTEAKLIAARRTAAQRTRLKGTRLIGMRPYGMES